MASIGKLYGAQKAPKTLRAQAAAKYNGLELEYVPVDLAAGDHKKADYAAKFPMSKVPAFEGSDGFLLSESRAIARYIAGLSQNSNLLGNDSKSAALIDQWANFADDELFAPGVAILLPTWGMLPYTKPHEDRAWAALNRALAALEKHLHTQTFLVGHRVTLADLTVVSNLVTIYTHIAGPEIRKQYPNTLRYLTTVINQPVLGDLFTKEYSPAAETKKYVAPKKEEKPKAAPAAAAATPAPAATKKDKKKKDDDDGEDDDLVPAEPKVKNPLDDLPKSPFILDEWKRVYSNKDTRKEAIPWLWENFDAEGWSVWRFDFKYNEELTQVFMSANQIGGFFNRLEASRKYVFGTAGVFGEANKSAIAGVVITRGKDYKPVLNVAPDLESYNVSALDITKPEDKKFFEDMLAWEATVDGKAWNDGKILK